MHEENAGKPDWETPTAIKEMPELEMWEAPYVKAFYMLSGSRQSGMGVGAILLSEILAYCDFFNEPEPELFLYIIQRMDSAFLEEYNRQQDAKPKK